MPHAASANGKFLKGNHCFSRPKGAQIRQETRCPKRSVWATEKKDLRGPHGRLECGHPSEDECGQRIKARRVFRELGVRWRQRPDPPILNFLMRDLTDPLLQNPPFTMENTKTQRSETWPQASHVGAAAREENGGFPTKSHRSFHDTTLSFGNHVNNRLELIGANCFCSFLSLEYMTSVPR